MERYYIIVSGDYKGWIYVHEQKHMETEDKIELVEEFTSGCSETEIFEKSRVKEITKEQYYEVANTMVNDDGDVSYNDLIEKLIA